MPKCFQLIYYTKYFACEERFYVCKETVVVFIVFIYDGHSTANWLHKNYEDEEMVTKIRVFYPEEN